VHAVSLYLAAVLPLFNGDLFYLTLSQNQEELVNFHSSSVLTAIEPLQHCHGSEPVSS